MDSLLNIIGVAGVSTYIFCVYCFTMCFSHIYSRLKCGYGRYKRYIMRSVGPGFMVLGGSTLWPFELPFEFESLFLFVAICLDSFVLFDRGWYIH